MRDDDQLILVDSDDREIGYLAKADAHLGSGVIHRAFSYQKQYGARGAGHEACWVYAGHSFELPCANVDEIAAWRNVKPRVFQDEIICAPEIFTPWLKTKWARILRSRSWALGRESTANAPGQLGRHQYV